MELLLSLEKLIWFGCAAFGFAILFNVPSRTLPIIAFMGLLAGAVKSSTLALGGEVILGSFAGATVVGFISIWAAHAKHSPPFVLAIPAVIPMVPGAFAYRMMLGVIQLAGETPTEHYTTLLDETINNGLKTLFVLLALALGVSVPMLITRRETVKDFRFTSFLETRKRSKSKEVTKNPSGT